MLFEITPLRSELPGGSFSFEVYNNGLFDKGCAAKFSVSKANDFVYWLSKDRRGSVQVLKARAYPASRCLTALDQMFSTYATISDAEAFVIQRRSNILPDHLSYRKSNLGYNTSIMILNLLGSKEDALVDIASTYLAFNNKQYVALLLTKTYIGWMLVHTRTARFYYS